MLSIFEQILIYKHYRMKNYLLFYTSLFSLFFVKAQTVLPHRTTTKDSLLYIKGQFVEMPYNRMIQSAGKVITYGNRELENHALDLTVLPDKKKYSC